MLLDQQDPLQAKEPGDSSWICLEHLCRPSGFRPGVASRRSACRVRPGEGRPIENVAFKASQRNHVGRPFGRGK